MSSIHYDYDQKIVNQLWNAGYDLGQAVKARKSYPESIQYLKQLNYYRESNFQKFRDYLINIYDEVKTEISPILLDILKSEPVSHKYAAVFCMGYIGEKKVDTQV